MTKTPLLVSAGAATSGRHDVGKSTVPSVSALPWACGCSCWARTRAHAFRQAMEDLSRRYPDDDEAAIFHALTLLATAPPSDTTFANQKKAAEVLNRLLPRHPDHPGHLQD
jgi:hypothetical protein